MSINGDSEMLLKKLREKHGLVQSNQEPRKLPDSDLPPIPYPQYALTVQQRYKDESTRPLQVYSRGLYKFLVSLNVTIIG